MWQCVFCLSLPSTHSMFGYMHSQTGKTYFVIDFVWIHQIWNRERKHRKFSLLLRRRLSPVVNVNWFSGNTFSIVSINWYRLSSVLWRIWRYFHRTVLILNDVNGTCRSSGKKTFIYSFISGWHVATTDTTVIEHWFDSIQMCKSHAFSDWFSSITAKVIRVRHLPLKSWSKEIESRKRPTKWLIVCYTITCWIAPVPLACSLTKWNDRMLRFMNYKLSGSLFPISANYCFCCSDILCVRYQSIIYCLSAMR